MGLFDFITDVGSKLGGKIYDITHDEIDINAVSQPDPEQMNKRRASSITDNINESGVEVQNLHVSVDGNKATLTGKVNTQACSERLTLIAGNQFGIGSVDCQLEVANPGAESTMYTVKSGDTLSGIAKQVYGDASKYHLIFEANQPMLTDPNKIFVGQSLRIPS